MRLTQHTARVPRRRAFSLVELIVVLLIVGVLSAIAIPRFAGASARKQLDYAAQRVELDLETARTRARAASDDVTIEFDTDRDRYAFNDVGGEATVVELGESPYDVAISTAYFEGTSKIVFNGYGVPINPGTVTLKSGRGTRTITVTLGGQTIQ